MTLAATHQRESPSGWTDQPARLAPPPPPPVASWLLEPGLLTERVRRRDPDRYALRLVAQSRRPLAWEDAALLGDATQALVREIELTSGDRALVFAQTLVPEGTLAVAPWLAELGTRALGPTLAARADAVRGPLEFAALVHGDALYEAACRARSARPTVLYARRSRYAVAGAPLVVQEVFLPEAGA